MPADRFSDARQYKSALGEPGHSLGSRRPHAAPPQAGVKGIRIASLGAAAILGAGAAWALLSASRAPSDATPTYLSLATPAGVVPIDDKTRSMVAISPNGRRVVYIGSSPGRPLYLQDLDVVGEAQPIPGTEGAVAPFFSSDGEWIGFAADNALKKISLRGGAPNRLADATFFRGGSWSPDGATIYYTPRSSVGIFRVSSDGGEGEAITTPERDGLDNEHYWPETLPDGEGVLFTSCCSRPYVMHLNVATGEVTPLVEGFHGRYALTGHLVYMQPGSVLAAAFDPRTLEVGTPVEVADDVLDGLDYHAEFDISESGSLAYLSGPSTYERTLIQYDRSGVRQQLYPDPRGLNFNMRFSPDATHLAVTLQEGQADIFLLDLGRRDLDPLVIHPANDFWPIWSRDGARIAFLSVRNGPVDLFVVPTDKSAPPQLIFESDYAKWPESWSPDGRLLAFSREHPQTGSDILLYSFDDDDVSLLLGEPFNESVPEFSPDGRWLAYQADDSGRYEVYVVPFPVSGPRCKVSTSGGEEPRWSGDGGELFYRSDRTAMVARAAAFTSCISQPPEPMALFDGLERELWDVHPGGELFVTVDLPPQPQLRLIQNWSEVLKQRVPN